MSAQLYADPATLYLHMLRRCVRTPDGCWSFTGALTSRGYACVGAGNGGRNITGHRLSVIVRDGSIPEGMTVDHACHRSEDCRLDTACPHRACVNPAHLVVMSMADNLARQYESGKCRKGHPLSTRKRGNGTQRYCRQCSAAYLREWKANRALLVTS